MLAGRAVQRAHADDDVGDLLAVGADVLDRRRADAARDARQRLDAGQPVARRRRPRARPSPRRPRRRAGRARRRRAAAATPRVATRTTVPSKPVVGDDDVAAAGEHEQRLAGGVGRAHDRDELVLGRAPSTSRARRAAEAQRRQRAQSGKLGHGCDPRSRGRVRLDPARLAGACRQGADRLSARDRVDEQEDVQRDDQRRDDAREDRRGAPVHQLAHHVARAASAGSAARARRGCRTRARPEMMTSASDGSSRSAEHDERGRHRHGAAHEQRDAEVDEAAA